MRQMEPCGPPAGFNPVTHLCGRSWKIAQSSRCRAMDTRSRQQIVTVAAILISVTTMTAKTMGAALTAGNVAALSAPDPPPDENTARATPTPPVQLLLSGDAAASVQPKSDNSQSGVAIGGGLGLSSQWLWLMLTIDKSTSSTLTGSSYTDFSQTLLMPSSSSDSATVEARFMHGCWLLNSAKGCADGSYGLMYHGRFGANNLTISSPSGAPTTFQSSGTIYSLDLMFGILAQGKTSAATGSSAFVLSAEAGPILRVIAGNLSSDDQSVARNAFSGSSNTLYPGVEMRFGFQLNNLGFFAAVPFLWRGGSELHDGALILGATVTAPIVLDFATGS